MTTWFDLTDLSVHRGSVGGIERVQYHVITEYLAQAGADAAAAEEVGFFRFDETHRRFVVTDFETVRARLEADAITIEPDTLSAGALRARGLIRRYVPEPVARSRWLRRAARGGLRRGRHGLATVRQTASRTVARAGFATAGQPLRLAAGDTIVVLGKPWDRDGMSAALAGLKRESAARLVVMVYDLIPSLEPQLHHPDVFVPYTTFLFELVAAADLVITYSRATEADLHRFAEQAGAPMPPVGRIRLGDELPPVEPRRPAGIPDDFLLSVGTIEVRKNHALLYAVYKLAQTRQVSLPPLVIVGRPGWFTEDVRALLARDPAIQGRIMVRSQVSDAELAWLYRNCRFAVYPSLYEGWGLPVAEAAALGTVTACSDATSIPEIAGPALRYFSPYSAQECLDVLRAYLDPAELEAARAGLRHQYRATTWAETARQARELIRRA